jgi:GntR family transcriptional regulator, rspAB operon transcriptional repressor
MNKPPIIEQPKPIRKQVYEYLQEQILNNKTEPAVRLVEAQIAKDMGISRTPVREALHLLEKDGFIESIPRVGYQVKKPGLEDLDKILEIRKVNELLACRWAIQSIDKKHLALLEKNVEMTGKLLDKGKPAAFVRYDEEFHDLFIGSSGSKHLEDICQHLRHLMFRYRTESMKTRASVQQAFNGHVSILEKLKQKDEEGLKQAIIEHLEFSRDNIRRTFADAAI